jgi:hypothetical protein
MLPWFIRITNKTSNSLVTPNTQSCAHSILSASSIAETYFEHSSSNRVAVFTRIEAVISTVHVKQPFVAYFLSFSLHSFDILFWSVPWLAPKEIRSHQIRIRVTALPRSSLSLVKFFRGGIFSRTKRSILRRASECSFFRICGNFLIVTIWWCIWVPVDVALYRTLTQSLAQKSFLATQPD